MFQEVLVDGSENVFLRSYYENSEEGVTPARKTYNREMYCDTLGRPYRIALGSF